MLIHLAIEEVRYLIHDTQDLLELLLWTAPKLIEHKKYSELETLIDLYSEKAEAALEKIDSELKAIGEQSVSRNGANPELTGTGTGTGT